MRIVLDTNVLVSALLNPEGIPSIILGLVLNGKLKLLYDNRILSEYIKVLHSKKFKFKPEWVEPLIDFIRSESEFIIAYPVANFFKDEDDKKFYEIAKTANAKYLITGNTKHFSKEDMVKTPKEFFDIYIDINKEHE